MIFGSRATSLRDGRPRTSATWLILCLLLAGCSDEDTDDRPGDGPASGALILGTVFDRATGEPLRDAQLSTDPPTQEVATRADGTFDIGVPFGEYEVFARHLAYRADQARIVVADGESARVEFGLDASAAGLVASPAMLQFVGGAVRETFLLTSTVPDTGFSVTVTEPWISVVPAGGVIVNGENLVLTVTIDGSGLPAGTRVDGQIVLNTSNGTEGVVMPVLADREIGSVSEVGPQQNECRRPDLFRTGLRDPSLALIQFLPSLTLPAEAGLRSLSLPGNPSLVDSVVVTELGFLSIAHVSGGSENTTMRLLELSPEDELVVLADSSADGPSRGRGAIDYAVQPGVYCYLLGPDQGVFSGQTDLVVELGWRAEE